MDKGKELWKDRMSEAVRSVQTRRSIFKIPEILHRHNRDCYHPSAFSIGPIHHGKPHLRHTENFKLYYIQKINKRNQSFNLEALIRAMTIFDAQARRYYYDIQLPQDPMDFFKILVIDGCFLIELLLRWQQKPGNKDPIFYNPTMREQLLCDLVLLENQIPWLVLKHLYTHINPTSDPPLSDLPLRFLRHKLPKIPLPEHNESHDSEHLLDLLRRCLLASSAPDNTLTEVSVQSYRIDRYFWNSGSPGQEEQLNTVANIPTATALWECGVKFQRGTSRSWLDVKFNKETGTLVMTPLTVDELTEPLLRNLIGFEQCYTKDCAGEFTSYAILMDKLVNDTKDAQLMCRERVIDNWLGPEDVVRLFTNLYRDTNVEDFCYHDVVEGMNDYCQGPWRRLQAASARNNSNSPWPAVSQFGALSVPILNLLQTIFTIAGYDKTS